MAQASMNLTQLLDTFQLIDKNKDGTISLEEVTPSLRLSLLH